jgi:hypothetical protein
MSSIRVAQRLARHTSIELTAGTYQDARMLDTSAAVSKLPGLRSVPEVGAGASGEPNAEARSPSEPAEKSVALPVAFHTARQRPFEPETVRNGPNPSDSEMNKNSVFSSKKRDFQDENRDGMKIGATGFEPALCVPTSSG